MRCKTRCILGLIRAMPPSARKSFIALLEPDGTRLRWVIARVPFDIAKMLAGPQRPQGAR